jgi:hypothetical protein
MSEPSRYHRTFVLRVWRESEAEDWRGSVEDVGSGHRLSSARLGDLTDFMVVRLDDGGPLREFLSASKSCAERDPP